jgi:hypothetical protein
MENLILSPTRARTVGPGTWSPKVHALNFTPGAISMILWVVSSRQAASETANQVEAASFNHRSPSSAAHSAIGDGSSVR